MKTPSILLFLAAAAIANAQDCSQASEPFYNITSKPFHLVVQSEDGEVNDTLSACHVGAALESLCLSNGNFGSSPIPIPGAEFYFNTSIYSYAPDESLGVPGILTWILQTNAFNVPSSAAFQYDPISSLAVPIISPGSDNPTLVTFDSQDDLTIQAYVRASNGTGNYEQFYRWYACETFYGSYNYKNLAWNLGSDKPENPSCIAVSVTRVFV